MSKQLKLAFAGCGVISHYHLRGIQEQAKRIRITAAIDPNQDRAQKIADETGAQVYATLTQALERGDFEAVDLMLPHDLHEPAALEAFRAGKHVLLEKPMAPTLEATQRILAAAQSAGTVFMVAENAQYWPEVVKAQDLINNGAIGEIITARAAFVSEPDDVWFQDNHPWRYERSRTGGGIVIDGGSHWIRPLRMWLGEIDEVVAVVGHPLEQMEGESLAHAIFRFRSGQVATFEALMPDSVLSPQPWWMITGTLGQIVIDGHMEGCIRLFDKQHRDGQSVQAAQGYPKSFGFELADFERAVLDGKPLAAGPEESLGELRTAMAIYRSATSGQWEKVWT